MPKIYLKPNSPEFDDDRIETDVRACDMHGCGEHGEHKAPKHRGLNDYHHFCLDHVREYNKAWNFFQGMAPHEVEEHTINAFYGDRPTWKYGVNGDHPEDNLHNQAWQFYTNRENDPSAGQTRAHAHSPFKKNSPEFEAMAIMGLEPPLSQNLVDACYKELVKKHHPDLNKGCLKSESLLKSVNMAYTILRASYEAFEILPER